MDATQTCAGAARVKLDGARCLVIGGARRLGAVIALDLAAHGADVAVGTRSAPSGATETCAAIRDLGRRGATVTGDVAAPSGAAGLVAAAAEALDGLDVLVYAASGPFRPAAPQDIEPRDWQASFDVRRTRVLRGRLCRSRALRRQRRQRGR